MQTKYNLQSEEIRYLAASYDAYSLQRRLGFSNSLEMQFRRFYGASFNSHRLRALIFMLLLFFFSAVLDYFNDAQLWLQLATIKYGVGMLVVLAMLMLVNSKYFITSADLITTMAFCILALVLLLCASLGREARFELYLPLFVILVLGAALLPRLLLGHFWLIGSLVFVLSNIFLITFATNDNYSMLVAFNLYFLVALSLGTVLCYFFERGMRRQFISQKLLVLEREQRHQLGEELATLANIDPVTGLGNFAHLRKSLEMEWYRAIRNKKTLSLLLVDIDYYSNFRAQNGEQLAIEVLGKVAKTLEHTFKRAADLVARYQNDGFVVLLPETSSYNASRLAQLACNNVRELKLKCNDARALERCISVSIGQVSIEPNEHDDSNSIIKKADAALYLAKRNGRDGYYLYNNE